MWRATRFDTAPGSRYESPVPKKPSHVPPAVRAIPVVGDAMRSAEAQARWMQELLEQNARLVGQFPATMKSFNDSIERFNQTVGRLDRAVTRIEAAAKAISVPMEKTVRTVTDTQRQVARLQATVDRVIAVASELPGAGMLRRIVGGPELDGTGRPKPG